MSTNETAALLSEIDGELAAADRARSAGHRSEEIGHWTVAQLRAEDLAAAAPTDETRHLAGYLCEMGRNIDRAFALLDRAWAAVGA